MPQQTRIPIKHVSRQKMFTQIERDGERERQRRKERETETERQRDRETERPRET